VLKSVHLPSPSQFRGHVTQGLVVLRKPQLYLQVVLATPHSFSYCCSESAER